MPRIPLITSDVNPAFNLPDTRASGNDFGAQVGAAQQQFGSELARSGEKLAGEFDQIQKKQQAEGVANAVAGFDFTPTQLQLQRDAPANGAGLLDKTAPAYQDAVNKYVGGLDPSVQSETRSKLMQNQSTYTSQNAKMEFTLQGDAAKDAANAGLDVQSNIVRGDPTQYDAAASKVADLITNNNSLPAALRGKVTTAALQGLAKSRFDGMFEKAKTPQDVAAIQQQLNDPVWQGRLDSRAYDQLRDTAQSTVTSMQTKASAQFGATLDDLEHRGGDPKQLIPAQDIADAVAQQKAIVAAGGQLTPNQSRRFADLISQQQTFRSEGKLPADAIQGKISGTNIQAATDTNGRAQQAMQYFQSQGYSQVASAAIVGNLLHESGGLNTGAINRGDGSDGSDSIGIAQWNQGRAVRLKSFAAAQGKDWRDFGTQLAFVNDELHHEYGSVRNSLMNAKDVNAATAAFTLGYEVPAGSQTGDATRTAGWQSRISKATALAGGTYQAAAGDGVSRADYVKNQAREQLLSQIRSGTQGKDADMMTFASSPNIGVAPAPSPLNTSQDFAQRGVQANAVASYYRVPADQATPLTKQEVTQFSQVVQQGSADDQINLLSNLKAMGPTMYAAAARQIGADNPVWSHAAEMSNIPGGGDAAAEVMRGNTILRDDKQSAEAWLNPPNNGGVNAKSTFAQEAGTSLNFLAPRDKAAMEASANAYYLQHFARKGDGSFNVDNYKASLAAVSGGGIGNVNGSPTVLPPGVDEDTFRSALSNSVDADYVEASVTGDPPQFTTGQLATAGEIRNEGTFRAIGGGAYNIYMNDGRPLIARQNAGQAGWYQYRPTADMLQAIAARTRAGVMDAIVPAAQGDTPPSGDNNVPVAPLDDVGTFARPAPLPNMPDAITGSD